jgi:multiple sugar transport system substrate-binding protein
MNKKKIFTLISSIALLGGLFSCGETPASSSAASSSAASGSDSAASVSVPEGTVDIRFWHTFGKVVIDGMQKKIDAFQKLVKTNDNVDIKITLEYQGGYGDIEAKVIKSFATGTTPTLAIAYPDHVADYIATEKNPGDYVVDMSSFASDSTIGFGKESWIGDGAESDLVQGFYNEGKDYTRSGLYSMPLMKSTEIMFYNANMLKKLSNTTLLPNTPYADILNTDTKVKAYMSSLSWDDFITLCQYIKNNMATVSTNLQEPFWYDSDANMFITKSYQSNIPFLSIGSDGKGSADFSNTESKAMVSSLKAIYD